MPSEYEIGDVYHLHNLDIKALNKRIEKLEDNLKGLIEGTVKSNYDEIHKIVHIDYYKQNDRLEKLEEKMDKLEAMLVSFATIENVGVCREAIEKLEKLLYETIERVGLNSDGCRKDLVRLNNLEDRQKKLEEKI